MKKYLVYLCSLALILTVLCGAAHTYDVKAAAIGDVSENDLPGEDGEWVREAREKLYRILSEHDVYALVYLSDTYPVKEAPEEESRTVAKVPGGQTVQIKGVRVNERYEIWEYVGFQYAGQEYSGYIQRTHLACSDEIFLKWEDECGMNPAAWSVMAMEADVQSVPEDIKLFPDSYQPALMALKEAHPQWTFVKMNVGLDWNTVVANEMVRPRSLIPSSFETYMWDGIFGPNWAYATKGSLEYYMDPRNWLTESGIFQFEQLTYNESYHTQAAVQAFLDKTFMSGRIPGLDISFAETFYAVGKEIGVSPFHLASRVYQEQGAGNSALISGTYPGYEGLYNYFNIGATGSRPEDVITSGLETAREKKWTDRYKSIYGGAQFISQKYILRGQDTLYLQKFDVDGNYDGLYWHQYMQNICAPSSEAKSTRQLYEKAGSLDNTFVFKIPVYNNMPKAPCPKPAVSCAVSLTLPEGYSDTKLYVDGKEYQAQIYEGSCFVELPDTGASTAVMYRYDENSVPVGMHVWLLSHNGRNYQAADAPELTDLLTYHGFSIRITGKSGIRMKSGISLQTRQTLLSSEGLSGYHLKEYGTVVMNDANRNAYPMVKGGEKTIYAMAYGTDEDGTKVDNIFETAEERLRFTLVLVGLPASQYKTEFAFRSYAVLDRDGREVTVYGPVVHRSIYALAGQILEMGLYPQGSDADTFLRTLINDADAQPQEPGAETT